MVSALVMTDALADGSSELASLLGARRFAELRDALVGQALQWAESVAPGAVRRAEGVAELAGALSSGPVVVVRPELPLLRADLAGAVLGDLHAGCELVLGPIASGGFYLIGVARPGLALSEELLREGDLTRLAGLSGREAEIGMLRVERPLRSGPDVEAALADPLLPDGLRRLLAG